MWPILQSQCGDAEQSEMRGVGASTMGHRASGGEGLGRKTKVERPHSGWCQIRGRGGPGGGWECHKRSASTKPPNNRPPWAIGGPAFPASEGGHLIASRSN